MDSSETRKSTREIAADLMLMREQSGADITDLLKASFTREAAALSTQDRAFLKQLVIGTTERLYSLDAAIDRIASVRVKAMMPTIRAVIRVGAYQILYLDAVRDAAAVDEAVKSVKQAFPRKVSGFVNAVLRHISRDKEELMTWLRGRDLSIRCSVSPYLCELLRKERGEEQAAAILAAGLVPRALSIRPDPRLAAEKERYDRWLDALRGAVGSVRSHPLLPRLLLVDDPGDIRKLPGFTEGAFAVQDAASALAVDAAGIGRDDLVLDVCAAPGGKAIYAASLLKDPSRMTARDLTEEKCALLKENAERMRLSGMRIRQQDATEPTPEENERYDVVFCDLPCTGFGVMGRKPEIKYRADAESTASLVSLQRKILAVAADYVKPGGKLIYSTCTISRAENEDNVRWFVENRPFVTESWTDADVPGVIRGSVVNGCLQLLPGEGETDGFFIARLRKKAL